MNEEFEKWVDECGYNIEPFRSVLELAWQASRKQALEDAAKACDVLAWEDDENMKLEDDERFGVYAKKYRKAASVIRGMQKD